MSISMARQAFEKAKELAGMTEYEAKIAEGLMELARGISSELTQLKRDIQEVKSRVTSIKSH
jgi:hypothetical protein